MLTSSTYGCGRVYGTKKKARRVFGPNFCCLKHYSLRYLSSQLKNSRFHTTLFCGWNTW